MSDNSRVITLRIVLDQNLDTATWLVTTELGDSHLRVADSDERADPYSAVSGALYCLAHRMSQLVRRRQDHGCLTGADQHDVDALQAWVKDSEPTHETSWYCDTMTEILDSNRLPR